MSTAERLARALENLHALVWGECRSLLDEDSGGDADLDLEIREVLATYRQQAETEQKQTAEWQAKFRALGEEYRAPAVQQYLAKLKEIE